jgi:hypothetical protein
MLYSLLFHSNAYSKNIWLRLTILNVIENDTGQLNLEKNSKMIFIGSFGKIISRA